MVVGHSLSPICRRGTHCENVYTTLPTALLFLAVFSKHSSSQSTDVCSALEALAKVSTFYITLHYRSIQQFESDRIRALEARREQRKTATIRSAACYPCQICGQTCASRIGLYSHSGTHQHWSPGSIVSTAQSNNITIHCHACKLLDKFILISVQCVWTAVLDSVSCIL